MSTPRLLNSIFFLYCPISQCDGFWGKYFQLHSSRIRFDQPRSSRLFGESICFKKMQKTLRKADIDVKSFLGDVYELCKVTDVFHTRMMCVSSKFSCSIFSIARFLLLKYSGCEPHLVTFNSAEVSPSPQAQPNSRLSTNALWRIVSDISGPAIILNKLAPFNALNCNF